MYRHDINMFAQHVKNFIHNIIQNKDNNRDFDSDETLLLCGGFYNIMYQVLDKLCKQIFFMSVYGYMLWFCTYILTVFIIVCRYIFILCRHIFI